MTQTFSYTNGVGGTAVETVSCPTGKQPVNVGLTGTSVIDSVWVNGSHGGVTPSAGSAKVVGENQTEDYQGDILATPRNPDLAVRSGPTSTGWRFALEYTVPQLAGTALGLRVHLYVICGPVA